MPELADLLKQSVGNSEKQEDVVTQQNKIDQLTEEIKAGNKRIA